MGRKGHPGSKTRGQHLEVQHCWCPNWDHPSGKGAKAERQQRDEGRDGEKAEGAMSTLRTNGTTNDALPSEEQDPHGQPYGGELLGDTQPELTDPAAAARDTH